MTNAADIRTGLQLAKEKFGEINGLVNCAGIGIAVKTLDNKGVAHPIEDFTKVIQVGTILLLISMQKMNNTIVSLGMMCIYIVFEMERANGFL